MPPLQSTNGLSADLTIRVLDRLHLEVPGAANLKTLQRLYTAWCSNMPFDNIRKMIVLASGDKRALPGLNASDYFENWLTFGTGATCWPMANAFYELLISLGYNAIRVAGYMRDMGMLNHGSVVVSFSNQNYLAEASLLINKILPLGEETVIQNDPVFPMELESDGATHLLWLNTPPNEEYFCCRLINDPVSFFLFEERYEASRTFSIFNQRLYARRNYPEELIILWGNTRLSKTKKGVETRELTRDELCEALHNDIGISYALINEWVASGCLDASFKKPSGPHPPATIKKPPSQR